MFTSAASRLTCEQQLRLSLKESRYRLRGETVHSKDDSQALLPGEYNMHQPPPSQNNFDGDSHLQVHEDLFKYAASALYEKEYPNVENYIQYATARLRLKQLKGVMPLRPEFGTVVNDVTSFEFSLNKEQCAIAKSNRTMFVAICSASTSIAKRASIRETWLKQIQSHADAEGLGIVGVRFVIARPQEASVQEQLELESKKYSDILQVDIMETNKNLLTLKGIALLNWVHSYCSNATLLLKVHDHVFVNTRVLIQNFARINDNGPVVYGRLVSDLVNKGA